MRRATFEEVHPYRARSLRAELLDLQAVHTDLHGERSPGIIQRQAQARRPALGLRLIFGGQCLDPDPAFDLLLHTHLPARKKVKDRRPRPIHKVRAILPELFDNHVRDSSTSLRLPVTRR